MMGKKRTKTNFLRGVVFGLFLAVIGVLGMGGGIWSERAYAEPAGTNQTQNNTGNGNNSGNENQNNNGGNNGGNNQDNQNNQNNQQNNQNQNTETNGGQEQTNSDDKKDSSKDVCQQSLGAIGWLVCPVVEKMASALDWLYEKIQDILIVNPVPAEDGSPIYEIWKYCLGLTNIVFIIFLLIVIYSQITGLGISNYGVKKTLPKLIVVAIVVNLSFLICTVAVDVSNIAGNSLRGLFTAVEQSAMSGISPDKINISGTDIWMALTAGGTVAAGAAVIVFENGMLWLLIPTILGALVSVIIGLLMITLRQALITLLIMVSPLAVVAYMLPNTEHLAKKWRQLFLQMLMFYPMFSALFGASSLAGSAIIMSAKDGLGIIIGVAVKVIPLFFAWKLMQMSGTVLGAVSAKMHGLAAKPLAANRAWADSKRMATKQKHLADANARRPSVRLMQYMSNRKVAREAEMGENAELAKKRGLAYRAKRNYDKDGIPNKRAEEAMSRTRSSLEYEQIILRNENNMNKGLSELKATEKASSARKARLAALGQSVGHASDALKMEKARGEKIEFENAIGFYERMNDAIGARTDEVNGYLDVQGEDGRRKRRQDYKFNIEPGTERAKAAAARYKELSGVMEGDEFGIQYAAATAAQGFDSQAKMAATKFQKYFDMIPPSREVENRLKELTQKSDAAKYVDAIIPGLRVLNDRGDTDVVKMQMNNIMNGEGGVELGSHASQSLANFLMFEVKGKDPFLRRFGKYINLETARAYNSSERKKTTVDLNEYVLGYHDEPDPNRPGQTIRMYSKKDVSTLLEGTSMSDIERVALESMDQSLKEAYTYTDDAGNKRLDLKGYLEKRKKIQNAIAPQFGSAINSSFMSGSEQMKSAIKFLTGYEKKQRKEKYIDENGVEGERLVVDDQGNPVSEWVNVWNSGEFAGREDDVREYYEQRTLDFIAGQTPSQILGMRSDFKEPFMEHLANAYLKNDGEKWRGEKREVWDEYMQEYADIQTRYGDLPADEAEKRRAADRAKLKEAFAGQELQDMLDKRGKLLQIYGTRKSGGANNAKDWVRQWLGLDDERWIAQRMKEMKNSRRKRNGNKSQGNSADQAGRATKIYSEDDRIDFIRRTKDILDKNKDKEKQEIYGVLQKYLRETFSESSYINKQFEKFCKDNPDAEDDMVREYLKTLLEDPDNY